MFAQVLHPSSVAMQRFLTPALLESHADDITRRENEERDLIATERQADLQALQFKDEDGKPCIRAHDVSGV